MRRRRFVDGRRRYGRLAGVKDDFFRPFVRRLDPYDRPVDGQPLTSEHHRWRWQTPAGDEQQSRKRASNEDKIAGYGHRTKSCLTFSCYYMHATADLGLVWECGDLDLTAQTAHTVFEDALQSAAASCAFGAG